MGQEEAPLKVVDETEFDYRGHSLKMRHYNDGTWELLDERNLPIVQGSCKSEAA